MTDYLFQQVAKEHLSELRREAAIFRSLRSLISRDRLHPKQAAKPAAPQSPSQPVCCPAGA